MNDVYKALEEDDRQAAKSRGQSKNLKISPLSWLDSLLDYGEICFPDHATLQSGSMVTTDSKDGQETSSNKEKATYSSGIAGVNAAAKANVSAPLSPQFVQKNKTEAEDPNGVEFQKLVSWTKDVSNRKSAAAQAQEAAQAFAQEQRQKQTQGQGQADGNVILLSKLSKQSKSKGDAKGNASSVSSPTKKRLFKKGKTKKLNSSATQNKKEESSSAPKATPPKPKVVQQQQQTTEERQDTNDDWRHVTWRSMVTNKAPNPNASQNNRAPTHDPKRDIPSGVFIPPTAAQSVYGAPMNDHGYRYGVPPGSPQPHHGQHYYPPQPSSPYGSNPSAPYGGQYSPHHQHQYPQQQHYPPHPQQQYHQYEQNYPPHFNPNVNSSAAAHYDYNQGQARSPKNSQRFTA